VEDAQRTRVGIVGLIAGLAIFTAGFMAVHFIGLPETDSIGRDLYPFVPRGWQWDIGAKIVALIGSQIMVAAVVFGWLFDRTLTWARASVGAMIFTMEIIVWLGIVPNEWLGLAQGEFAWTSQKVAFTLPSWLVLNNGISISYGAIKDIVSGTYAAGVLGAVLVGMYKYQEWDKTRGEAKPLPLSDYGRPVVKEGSSG